MARLVVWGMAISLAILFALDIMRINEVRSGDAPVLKIITKGRAWQCIYKGKCR